MGLFRREPKQPRRRKVWAIRRSTLRMVEESAKASHPNGLGAHKNRASRGAPLRAASVEAALRFGPVIVNELGFCGRHHRHAILIPRTQPRRA